MKSRRTMLLTAATSLIGLATLSACSTGAGSQRQPSGLASSRALAPDTSIGGAWIYRNPQANFSKYRSVMLDDTVVYGGPEANFGDASTSDRQGYARIVTQQMRRVLGEKYRLVNSPGPDVIRIRPTLIGVRGTVGGVATVTRILPMGIAINAVRGAAGAGGSMTGGIELAVELHDSVSNELLGAAVRQVAPGAFDLEATLSTDKTVQSSAATAATALRDALDRNLRKGA